MSPKWFIWIGISWLLMGILGIMLEGVWLGDKEAGVLNTLTNLPIFTGGGGGLFGLAWRFVQSVIDPATWLAFAKMMMFDLAMFTGTASLLRFVIFLPIAAAIYLSLALAVRGTSSG